MNVLGLIPARGGSKGIPKKNIRPLLGKPLLYYTVRAALQSRLLTHITLSTDSLEIAEAGRQLGVDVPFIRPAELAGDDTPAYPVVVHAVTEMEKQGPSVDIVVILQPTSPLRTNQDIDGAIQILLDSDADSVVSVVDVPHCHIPESIYTISDGALRSVKEYSEARNLKQMKPKYYARNGAMYAFRKGNLSRFNSIYGKKILPYFMPKNRSVDIDDETDWALAELLLTGTASSKST